MFIFLNKTCFRGVFRIGPKGFNVPYGHYKNPEIINKKHLEQINLLIQNVIFECKDFNTSLATIETNDYVYLDPPYAPETDTSFVGYTENGFNIDNHKKLFELINKLTEKNIKIMSSNADVSLVRNNFTNEKYNITSILCKRAINSKNPQAKAKEVIIKNY
jgi:DNA adenine methylase